MDVHHVGEVPRPGDEPRGYQRFWAAMSREGLVGLMTDDFDHPVTADDICPLPSSPAP